MKVRCCNCGWIGEQADLINSICVGRERYVGGEECPVCWSREIEDNTNPPKATE